MTPADNLRLISHLNSYARQFSQSIEVELCLDRFPGDPGSLQDSLRVLWAHYPQNGDNLTKPRPNYHSAHQFTFAWLKTRAYTIIENHICWARAQTRLPPSLRPNP